MKKTAPVLLLSFIITCMLSCSSSLKVTTDYDKNVNFTQYKSFGIDTFKMYENVSQLNQGRIINAVKADLIKKGFTESSSPDMLVHISVILQNKKSVSSNTDYYGYGGFYRPYMWGGGGLGATGYTTYNVQNYKDGSLIIDIVDANTKKLFWEGIGNQEIDKPLKDPDTEIPVAISSILAGFPPGMKK